jgi:uncharacterized RDD family membrane protein YckC
MRPACAAPLHDPIVLAILLVLYWGVLEGIFGVAYGKHRCGIRVTSRNGDPPGVLRGLARSALFVLAFGLPLALTGLDPTSFSAQTFPSVMLGLAVGALVWPARPQNGFAGLHDLLTSTRVVKRSRLLESPRRQAALPIAEESTGERVGPYEVVSVVGPTESGRMLLGRDPWLKRPVWIHVLSTDARPVSAEVRNASRAGRLHWLNGLRTESGAWDAYEPLNGQPLLALVSGQPWRSVSKWLCDLAHELEARSAEGSTDALTLDRIWITNDGRGKLLDFRAPGLSARDSQCESFAVTASQQFLHAAARYALGSPVPPPPLSVSKTLRRLKDGGFDTLTDVVASLSVLQSQPDRVTHRRRGMTLGLGVVVYLLMSNVLGSLIFQHLPSSARLSLTLHGAGLIGCGTLGLLAAFVLRSGVWLRAFCVAVVTPDGVEASRLRAVYRAAVAWSWVPVQLAAVAYGGPLLAVFLLKVGGLFYAADHPVRGLQDRLAGTYLVPR